MTTHYRYTVAVDLGKRAHVATLLEAAAGDIWGYCQMLWIRLSGGDPHGYVSDH